MIYILVFWLLGYIVLFLTFQPSHNRNWELGHEKLPHLSYSSSSTIATIENYRDFNWTSVKEAEVNYTTRDFDLSKIQTVDVFISHFDDFEGLAHIFLSFGLTDGEHIVVSLETRREVGENFSPLLGVLRQFEIIYVVGSERDIVGVRTGHRNERVYLYPTTASPEKAQALFAKLTTAFNDVYETPRMYNTLTHNCTNELTRPVESISDVNFPLTWKTILPGYFDEILYELGLIDNSVDFITTKYLHLLDNGALDTASPTYSQDMRRQITP